MVYVSNSLSNTVSVIDVKTNTVIATINMEGKYPTGIAVNDNSNLVYVANTYLNNVSIINGTTNKIIATIKVGNGPSSIAVDIKYNLVYVTNYKDNFVSVINGTTNLGQIIIFNNLQRVGLTSIVVNSDNNKLYVLNNIE